MAKVHHVSTGIGIKTDEEWVAEVHQIEENDGILLVSNPPSGFHKIYNLYAVKTGNVYHLQMDVEDIPK